MPGCVEIRKPEIFSPPSKGTKPNWDTHDRHSGISYRSSTAGSKGIRSETSQRGQGIQRNKDYFSDEISISLRYMLGNAYKNSFNNVRTRCVDMITLTLQKMKGFQRAMSLALSLAFLLSELVTIGSI